ncbi:pescadillo-like protein [Hibiscus syriacus]|uniref:Pescadillo-like protein n=1 Tax=Hibiscus syriacus TaxID=106335 RepID=A0A6A2YXJ4_HIBSY|nr:basic leucine zipper 43-like [Hibiscus syriacus]KAE8683997.1 pescadillo-like protein [Hibiscus syriacus]
MEVPGFDVHREHQPHGSLIQSFFAVCPSQKTLTTSAATDFDMESWDGNSSSPQHPDSGIFSNRFSPNTQIHLFSPNASSPSNEDEARVCQQSIVFDEKRLRRMISNRESARRSRMRKKQQIEELQSQVNQLQTVNRQLSQKVINLLENNHEILQENTQLKEKVSTLHVVLSDVFAPLRNSNDSSMKPKSDS